MIHPFGPLVVRQHGIAHSASQARKCTDYLLLGAFFADAIYSVLMVVILRGLFVSTFSSHPDSHREYIVAIAGIIAVVALLIL